MDDEEANQSTTWIPITQLSQANSDFASALSFPEEERAFLMLTTSESDEEEDYSRDDGADEEDGDDHEDFDSDEEEGFWEEDDINDEVESTEEENSDYDGDTGEDDTDQDEFSYEGLILLGEILGMNRGLPADEVTKFLRPCEYKIECKNGLDRCVICQVDYEEGESLVSLPCEHPYHSDCISNWLQIKKVCPICSTDVSSPPLVKD
uniref:RING-type domain-containing protein n=2 Tax=Nelumbo nucifera TaxID=4432 RepID=A0A822Z7L9_NELNU|nr:TPA_asm: hypothetical protein HUJ06_013712 [Nelumbo nucifera]